MLDLCFFVLSLRLKESFLLKIVNKFREKKPNSQKWQWQWTQSKCSAAVPRRKRFDFAHLRKYFDKKTLGRNCSSQLVRWRHRYWRFGEEYARSARHGQDPVRATRQVRQWRALCPGYQRRGDHLEIVRRWQSRCEDSGRVEQGKHHKL